MRRKTVSPASAGWAALALSDARLRQVRVGVIRAEYNAEITRRLETKCVEGLEERGLRRSQIECYPVPGCFEIPVVAERLASVGRFDVLIALGAVIRGETLHFELVANECARGVMEVSLKHGIPVIFEVLATKSRRDAVIRSGNNRANKGYEAASAALAVLALLDRIAEGAASSRDVDEDGSNFRRVAGTRRRSAVSVALPDLQAQGRKARLPVIPAKTGIRLRFDPRFRGGDVRGFRPHSAGRRP